PDRVRGLGAVRPRDPGRRAARRDARRLPARRRIQRLQPRQPDRPPRPDRGLSVRVSALDEAPLVRADDRATWRAWLEANHGTSRGAWLVTLRKGSGLDYEAAVEEALCFGWVDSTGGVLDAEHGKLYFARRKARSPWSASNKARVERLIAA